MRAKVSKAMEVMPSEWLLVTEADLVLQHLTTLNTPKENSGNS